MPTQPWLTFATPWEATVHGAPWTNSPVAAGRRVHQRHVPARQGQPAGLAAHHVRLPPIDKERGYDLVEQLDALARAKGSTIPRLALPWVLGQRGITSVIIGAKRPEQLEDNLLAVDVEWSDDELATLTAPPRLYPSWMQANFARS